MLLKKWDFKAFVYPHTRSTYTNSYGTHWNLLLNTTIFSHFVLKFFKIYIDIGKKQKKNCFEVTSAGCLQLDYKSLKYIDCIFLYIIWLPWKQKKSMIILLAYFSQASLDILDRLVLLKYCSEAKILFTIFFRI